MSRYLRKQFSSPGFFLTELIALERGLSNFMTRNYTLKILYSVFPRSFVIFKNKDRFWSKAYGRFHKKVRYLDPV